MSRICSPDLVCASVWNDHSTGLSSVTTAVLPTLPTRATGHTTDVYTVPKLAVLVYYLCKRVKGSPLLIRFSWEEINKMKKRMRRASASRTRSGYCIHPIQEREQRRAAASIAMNLQVPQQAGNLMTNCVTRRRGRRCCPFGCWRRVNSWTHASSKPQKRHRLHQLMGHQLVGCYRLSTYEHELWSMRSRFR